MDETPSPGPAGNATQGNVSTAVGSAAGSAAVAGAGQALIVNEGSGAATQSPEPAEGGTGARYIPHYHDRHEDHVSVSPSDLRRLSDFALLQEGVGAAGVFFLSGAFWLLVTLLAEHWKEYIQYMPWFVTCVISILFGAVLMWVGWVNFNQKRRLIKDLIPPDEGQ
jgi:hypothetical protein